MEVAFAIKQEIFGSLARTTPGAREVWFLLLKLLEVQKEPFPIPKKLHQDARTLVDLGIVLEGPKGSFCVNPDVASVSYEHPLMALFSTEVGAPQQAQ